MCDFTRFYFGSFCGEMVVLVIVNFKHREKKITWEKSSTPKRFAIDISYSTWDETNRVRKTLPNFVLILIAR